jgi:hypothetical protein
MALRDVKVRDADTDLEALLERDGVETRWPDVSAY